MQYSYKLQNDRGLFLHSVSTENGSVLYTDDIEQAHEFDVHCIADMRSLAEKHGLAILLVDENNTVHDIDTSLMRTQGGALIESFAQYCGINISRMSLAWTTGVSLILSEFINQIRKVFDAEVNLLDIQRAVFRKDDLNFSSLELAIGKRVLATGYITALILYGSYTPCDKMDYYVKRGDQQPLRAVFCDFLTFYWDSEPSIPRLVDRKALDRMSAGCKALCATSTANSVNLSKMDLTR